MGSVGHEKTLAALRLARAEPGTPSHRKSACRWFDSAPGQHLHFV